MASYLRQSATTVGLAPTSSPYEITPAVLPLAMLGTANTRLVACMSVWGPGHGANTCNANHNGNFPIDVGNPGDGTNQLSTDILIYNEVSSDATAGRDIYFGLTASYASSYVAAWVGEYVEIDQSNYGYQGNPKDSNGNVDYDASTAGTGSNASTVMCTRGGGNTCNYVPELGIWVVGGTGSVGVTGQTYSGEGYVTDGANIWLAVQDAYFNVTGRFNPMFILGATTTYYNWANLTMKTLAFPDPFPAGYPARLGVNSIYRR